MLINALALLLSLVTGVLVNTVLATALPGFLGTVIGVAFLLIVALTLLFSSNRNAGIGDVAVVLVIVAAGYAIGNAVG